MAIVRAANEAPLDNPPIRPAMPTEMTTDGDMAQLLKCKVYALNDYRKDLIRRDTRGENVATAYADAVNEVNECLAKLQALANRTLAVTSFPTAADRQTLSAAMESMETAIAGAANLATLAGLGDTVIRAVPGRGVA
jgi:hypothetical protein